MAKKKQEKKSLLKIDKQDYIEVNPDEEWLHMSVEDAFYDKNYYRIIDFYVLHTPCKSSYTPRTLEKLGWKNPWYSSKFRDAFDNVPGFVENQNFCMADSKKGFLTIWNSSSLDDFSTKTPKEFAVFTKAGEGNPRMNLLHHIRNAFAHGRFSVKKYKKEFYIYLEDVTGINGLEGIFVSARICLKKSTLITWLDTFEKKNDISRTLSSVFSETQN